ncbi:S8 family serine peptidase [Bacillus lacus]|uniref:S8 family serine peptidase n=1 Tax=Metabacillus lacus TaxID=1983721 RepID=A0A7X2J0A2_9BACI|nr:S8 family serine peptidase [Metabacillus lacus]MRX73083.1 S8 family serine peptidase [Metabacillus lacus]
MKMRKIMGAGLLSLSLSLSLFANDAFAKAPESSEKFRVVIKGSSTEKSKLKGSHGLHRDFGNDGFTTDVNEKQFQALQKNKNIEVEVVPEIQVAARQTVKAAAVPAARVPWGIKAIYNNSSLTSTSGGDGIKIAVLDTGVNTSHIDLAGNSEQCKDFTTTSTYVNNSCTDKNGHGTHVAGSALANGGSDGLGIYGVAPQAKLWAYKVLTDSGSGYSDDIAAAVRHAADEGTRTGSKVIISMSLGGSKDTLIANAVDYAYSKGALIIAAAGNSGYNANTIGYPGALPNAVAVAALENVQQNGTYRVANFSSRGNPNTAGDYVIQERDIEISSPGASIESTASNGGYTVLSGTSMATPHVSGLAAKIWSSNRSLSNVQVRADLQNRAKKYDIKGGYGAATGDDYASGFGFARVQ